MYREVEYIQHVYGWFERFILLEKHILSYVRSRFVTT